MSRVAYLSVVIVLAAMVATAMPVSAATADDVASNHTTDSDYQAASTLTNVTVDGSGSAASVALDNTSVFYNVVSDSGDGSTDSSIGYVIAGDTAGDAAITAELRAEPTANQTVDELKVTIESTSGSDYGATVDVYIVPETPDGTYGEGTLIKSGWDPSWSTGTQTISLDTNYTVDDSTTYTIELVSSGSDNDGSSDSISIAYDDSFSNTWYRSNSAGSKSDGVDLTLSGSVRAETGAYISANHSADGVTKAFANLTLDDVSATVTWEYWTGSQWQAQSQQTYTSSGNKTATWSKQSTSKWRVNVTYDKTSDVSASAELHDEGVLFDASAPAVNNSSMQPRGGEKLSSEKPTLEINVTDSDFATSQGDSLTVEFYVDGTKKGSSTVTSNGTAKYTVSSGVTGGSHDWHAVVADSYSEEQTSATQSFTAPGTLYIRNVSNVSELVDSPITVELRFFDGNGTIVERSTTTGKVNMSGLPVSGPIVVTAEASSDYAKRTAIIPSLYQQQSVFLMNTSVVTPAAVTFELEDKTGKFPADKTNIQVQAPVNQSNYSSGGTGVQWTTVSGDYFDASDEFDTTLEDGKRYRIVIRNSQNESRVLGQYVAQDQDLVPLPVGRVSFDTQGNESYGARVDLVTMNNQDYLRVVYRDGAEETSEVTYNISYRSNSTTIFSNRSVQGPLGTTTELIAVTNTTTNYQVTVWVDRDGETVRLTRYAGQVPEISQSWGVDGKWAELIGWVSIIALTGLAVIVNPRLASIIAVASATLLTWIGLVSLPGLALTLAGATAIILAVGGGPR